MPINYEIYNQAAVRGDISGIAIEVSIALDKITSALEKLAAERQLDIDEEIDRLRTASEHLDKTFDELTGWTAEDADGGR